MNRSRYAKFLHGHLVKESENGGYVLNLNAKWGAGKTYFINRWIDSIKDEYPVVYIDAWKQDYSDDPMLTVISSITSELQRYLPPGNDEIIKLSRKATRFFKSAAPLLAKGLIKKATGLNIDDISTDEEPDPDIDSNGTNAGIDSYNMTADVSGKLAKCLVEDHNEKLKTVEHLRISLQSVVDAIPKQRPAFIFIDELDRCRPSYAVEMLEVIKHFFETRNVVFVVATDTEQLQHAIKAVYGQKFDAQTYLGRFFRRRYSLGELSCKDFVDRYIVSPINDSKWGSNIPRSYPNEDIVELVSQIANVFELSLRETEQLADKYLATLEYANKPFNSYLLLILFVLRDKYHDIYDMCVATPRHVDFSAIARGHPTGKMMLQLYSDYLGTEFYAHKETETLRVFSMPLHEYLCESLKLTVKLDGNRYVDERNQLARRHDSYDIGDEKYKAGLLVALLGLQAVTKDYRDWVELAVSFDD
ncbi:P-loop NTPase fold protein [Vibrio sp. 10N.261.51.F12]|uniref:KAP family P-loop NTPase fold protein n=1 Tax=Vibrio sp. 10N.261.51.F12 TaxID=3229679 RepID=UPI00354DBFB1